jgi:adenylate cyclase
MLTVGAQAVTLTAARFRLSEKDKRRIRNIFSHYVSPEVVARIVDRGEASLRGEQRELTVMFTDLRGFTSLSEKLTPVQVVTLLNRYFTPMTALVRESGGTLDKFIGDALMAFWNAPLDVPGHPDRAVRAALAMQQSLAGLNTELQRDFGLTLRMGAGIHTGQAHVGNMGSDDLTNYTAVGDTVNLASRLEGLCSRYGVTLVTSGETASRCGEGLVLRELARLRVKGRAEPVDVFTVLTAGEASAQKELLEDWREALRLYRAAVVQRDAALLAQASQAFAALCAEHPGPLHQAYADACADLRARPADTWSDVWTLTGK